MEFISTALNANYLMLAICISYKNL